LSFDSLDPARETYAAAAVDHSVPIEILDDIPAHMNQSEQAAMKYIGWGPDHPIWQEVTRTSQHHTTWRLTSKETTDILMQLETISGQFDYSRAPRHLVKEGVLTVGGNDWVEDIILLAIFLFFVLPWLFQAFFIAQVGWIQDFIRARLGI